MSAPPSPSILSYYLYERMSSLPRSFKKQSINYLFFSIYYIYSMLFYGLHEYEGGL